MALAVLADVRRYLSNASGIDDTDLTPHLQAAEEWVRRHYHGVWDAVGTVTETFNFKRQDALLKLREESPTDVVITVFWTAASSGRILTVNTEYVLMPDGRIALQFDQFVNPRGLENVVVRVSPDTYEVVQVAYTPSGVVPATVREAVAIIAAAAYEQKGLDVSGLQSERLGDYSYSRGGMKSTESGQEILIPRRALVMLGPHKRYVRVRSI